MYVYVYECICVHAICICINFFIIANKSDTFVTCGHLIGN